MHLFLSAVWGHAVGGGTILAPPILHFVIRRKCMVNFTPWALYLRWKNRSLPTKWVAEWTPEPFRTSVEEKISCPRWDRTQDPSIRAIVFTLSIVGRCVSEKWLRSVAGMIQEWENLSILQKTFHSATFSTIKPVLIRLGSSQDLHVERSRTYSLKFGTCWGSSS